MSHPRDLGCFSLALQGWIKSGTALELARNAPHGAAHSRGRNSQKEPCNLGTPKTPGALLSLISKGLALGSTHRACKQF